MPHDKQHIKAGISFAEINYAVTASPQKQNISSRKSNATKKKRKTASNIKSTNKASIKLSSKLKLSVRKDFTLNSPLPNPKNSKYQTLILSGGLFPQENKTVKKAKMNNYLRISDKLKNNFIKLPSSTIESASREKNCKIGRAHV